jgi:hypothetical protein
MSRQADRTKENADAAEVRLKPTRNVRTPIFACFRASSSPLSVVQPAVTEAILKVENRTA